ncbi:MAG: heme-copper oxidase subunit III [Actinomycetes bacterium]
MPPVASATAPAPLSTPHSPAGPARPSNVAVGTIVWLSSELMFFAALFAMYFTVRAVQGPIVWKDSVSHLLLVFAACNTTVLVLSSVTCQMGVFAAERGDVVKLRRWFIISFVMGAVFIGGQIFEYAGLVRDGITLQTDYGSVFYLTTGFHGLHVTGGLIAFLFVLGRTYVAKRFTHNQATSAIVVSYYWHFVDIVWIGLFSTIYLIR